MSGTDAASLSDAEVLKAVTTNRKPVPVPPMDPGTGNQFPELAGTGGTIPLTFERLAAFRERTRNLPPARWLFGEVVPEAGRLLIVAAPNAGKTWLALAIIKVAAEQGRRILVVMEEGGARALADRFESLAIPIEAPIEMAHCQGFLLGNAAQRRQLIERLQAEDAPVLVLDPLVSMFEGDENDTREMNQVRAHLDELARANPKALLVLLHHTSKAGERGEGAAVYAGRGSTVLGGWADVSLNLRHEKSSKGAGCVAFAALVAKNRDGERGHRVRFELSLGDGTVSHVREEEGRPIELRHVIREALKAATAPLSASALAKQIGRRKEEVLKVVREMETDGELRKMGQGYRCTEAESSEDEEGES